MFRVLGPLEIEGGADLAPGSQERLLAVLLQRANEWVDADTVVAALWPDDPPASANGNVRAYVHQLRQVLPRAVDGSPRINTRSDGYRLNLVPSELDSVVFEELIGQGRAALGAGRATTAITLLTRAIELWRGEPYGPLGHDLARAEADRLRALRDDALDAYQQAREAQRHGTQEPPETDAEQTVVLQLGPPPDVHAPEPEREPQPWSQWRTADEPRRRRRRPAVVTTAAAVVAVLVAAGAVTTVVLTSRGTPVLGVATPAGAPVEPAPPGQPTAQPTSEPTVEPTTRPPGRPGFAARRDIPGLPAPGERKLLFGVGEQVDTARGSALVRDTPTRMLTTWYRGAQDLPRLRPWKDTIVKQAYADGFALHLIITATDIPAWVGTPHGAACGRPSVVQAAYLDEIVKLIDVFAGKAGSPPLFVTVFDQAQRYACNPGGYKPDQPTAAYYNALRDQYTLVRELFNRTAPNALVSLGWGAGLARSAANPETGSGLTMLDHFADELALSDFHSVSITEGSGDNAADLTAMIGVLGRSAPVMLSWYAPQGHRASVVDADLRALLDGEHLEGLTGNGLFAMSLAPDVIAASEAETARFVTEAINRYGRPAS